MNTTIKLLIAGLLFFSCGDSGPESSAISGAITKVTSLDLGDGNSPNDIRVSILLASGHGLTEIRAFLVNSSNQSVVTVATAIELSQDRYEPVSTAVSASSFRFTEGLLDFNGDVIKNGSQYTVMFLLISASDQALADLTGSVSLTEEPYLNGGYSGSWNDNLYTNFLITANLTFADGVLEGPFYYSNNFSSCCGGQNDGSIKITIGSEGSISFSYKQELVSFMGGACPGNYSGSGSKDGISFSIEFTGDDCEGDHTGGRIKLSKI